MKKCLFHRLNSVRSEAASAEQLDNKTRFQGRKASSFSKTYLFFEDHPVGGAPPELICPFVFRKRRPEFAMIWWALCRVFHAVKLSMINDLALIWIVKDKEITITVSRKWSPA